MQSPVVAGRGHRRVAAQMGRRQLGERVLSPSESLPSLLGHLGSGAVTAVTSSAELLPVQVCKGLHSVRTRGFKLSELGVAWGRGESGR